MVCGLSCKVNLPSMGDVFCLTPFVTVSADDFEEGLRISDESSERALKSRALL